MGMLTGGKAYFYITNLQGDVTGIVDQTGNLVVSYTYDAWGNPLSTTLADGNTYAATVAALNPLRYRGYVYDPETGLYYLQSRYYNPEIGRFLNADAFTSTGQGFVGNNVFAYCGNNPVNGYDPCGTCIHNWRLYDCEECAAFGNGVGEWFVDKYNRITNVHQQQTQLEVQIIMEQNEIVADATQAVFVDVPKAMWNAYVHSNELAMEAQYRNDMATKHAIESEIASWRDDPARAGDFVFMVGGNITAYIGYAALAATPGVGPALSVAFGIASAIWGSLRYYGVIE